MDAPTLFSMTERKARRQYRCYECGKIIEMGEVYNYSKGLWNGKFEVFKTCVDCEELRFHMNVVYGEYPPYGEVLEWVRENNNDIRHRI